MLWIYLLVVELCSPVRVLVWTIGNLRTQMPDEWSQQKMVWAFLDIQLSQAQVVNVSVQMKGQQWERIASSFDYQKSSCRFSGVKAYSSPPWPPYFLPFFLTQPIRWHLENREEIRLTYPGQEMMAGDWVQPSPTTIFNFLPNLFAPLHTTETTLLSLQQRLLAALWDTQVCSASEFAWSFLAPASYLSSYLCRMLQPKWWNHLLKLLLWANSAALLSVKVPRVTSELNDQDPFLLCSVLSPCILSETWAHTSLFRSLLLPHLNCNEEETPRGPVEATWVTEGQVFRTSCSRYLQTV